MNCYLALKGFGDACILINFLNRIQEPSRIFVRLGLYNLFLSELSSIHNVVVLNSCKDIFAFYNLRNLSFRKIVDSYFTLREIRNELSSKDTVFFDCYSIRNLLFLLPCKKRYITINNDNLYTAFSRHFSLPEPLVSLNHFKSCIIFPFGSLSVKKLHIDKLSSLVDSLKLSGYSVKVVVFRERWLLSYFTNDDCFVYTDIHELSKCFDNASFVLSVDTFQFHYGILKDKPTFLIHDGFYNKNFLPSDFSENHGIYHVDSIINNKISLLTGSFNG